MGHTVRECKHGDSMKPGYELVELGRGVAHLLVRKGEQPDDFPDMVKLIMVHWTAALRC